MYGEVIAMSWTPGENQDGALADVVDVVRDSCAWISKKN
jgi:hypothetical protein